MRAPRFDTTDAVRRRAGARPGAARPVAPVPVFLVVMVLATALGCSHRAPLAGRRQRALSVETEAAIGNEADRRLTLRIPIYEDDAPLTEYVASIGERMAAGSARHEAPWRFRILDSPEPNAFSLPGGYVDVTRGLLERVNSEDELAAALGHEIAHVAAGDTAEEIAVRGAPELSLLGAASPDDPARGGQLAKLADLAVAVAIEGFSPEREREADRVGALYAARAGFSSQGEIEWQRTRSRLESDAPARAGGCIAARPGAGGKARERSTPPAGTGVRREPYVEKLDGMRVGLWGRDGYVAMDRYVSTRHRFSLAIPRGWSSSLGGEETPLLLERRSEGLRAELRVEPLVIPGVSGDVARAFVRSADRSTFEVPDAVTKAAVPAGDAAIVRLRSRDKDGKPLIVQKVFFVRLDQVYVLTLSAPEDREEASATVFMNLVGSMHYFAPDEEAVGSEPRLALYRAKQGDTWSSIARARIDASAALETRLAAYNGFDPDHPPEPGLLIKVPPRAALP